MQRREGYPKVSGNEKQKTLVVAAICFPPVLIGPAILMGNLFRYFPEGSYHILMGRLDHVWPPMDKDSMLPAPYTFTRYPFLQSGGSWRHRVRSVLRDIFALLEVTWKGLRIIHREKINTIFVVADHYVELAALLMHWLTCKKIVLWLPDVYYVPENLKGWTRSIDRIIEPFLLRTMDTVLVTGEPTRNYYKEKYGLNTVVLAHSVELNKYNRLQQPVPHSKEFTDILYTGGVTLAQHGAIMDMIKIINDFPELNARLIIASIETPEQLRRMGIADGPRVVCIQSTREEIPVLQQSSDIIFLPLAFESHGMNHRTIVRTASPSKLPEYLAVGKPILVYAPSHSYYARYARQKGFGLVVDQHNPDLLCKAVFKLKGSQSLCQQLSANANRVAKEHHDAVKISAILQHVLHAS